jgi:hypothetical protein
MAHSPDYQGPFAYGVQTAQGDDCRHCDKGRNSGFPVVKPEFFADENITVVKQAAKQQRVKRHSQQQAQIDAVFDATGRGFMGQTFPAGQQQAVQAKDDCQQVRQGMDRQQTEDCSPADGDADGCYDHLAFSGKVVRE